jgi:hypothetical protein
MSSNLMKFNLPINIGSYFNTITKTD